MISMHHQDPFPSPLSKVGIHILQKISRFQQNTYDIGMDDIWRFLMKSEVQNLINHLR
jgi:hypothetical protein